MYIYLRIKNVFHYFDPTLKIKTMNNLKIKTEITKYFFIALYLGAILLSIIYFA
jgi:hypothetical protein